MVDHSGMKLGKGPVKYDKDTLQFNKYVHPSPKRKIALPPPSVAWSTKMTNLSMMLNDQIGDCAFAAIGHLIQAWSANAGSQIVVPDQQILNFYEKFGYVPGNPATDNGAVILDVLNYASKFGIDGNGLYKIGPFALVEPGNHNNVKLAIDYFGGIDIGLQLAINAQKQDVWHFDQASQDDWSPGSWGGHCVTVEDYDDTFLTCITWGQTKKMTWSFWDAYCDEAYAVLDQLFFDKNGKDPLGFDWASLMADLPQIGTSV